MKILNSLEQQYLKKTIKARDLKSKYSLIHINFNIYNLSSEWICYHRAMVFTIMEISNSLEYNNI